MKKYISFIILIFLACFAACSKPAEPLKVPDGFVALLDYKQLPGGKNYGAVLVASNGYSGAIKAEAQDKSKTIKIKPGQIKEVPIAFDLKVGDVIDVTGGSYSQKIRIKYDAPRAFSLGFVDTPGAMFTDETPFMATKGKGRYISVYHIAKTKSTTFGLPGKDTVWYAVSFKNKTTLNDKKGIIVIKDAKMKKRDIYYVTTYFYDSDFNYIGGSPGWEARYMPVQ